MGIIFGHSKDPILIKKIPLKIWYLRHEIEALLREKLQHEEGKSENDFINELIEEYVNTPPSNVIPINPAAGDGNEGKDDAAAAKTVDEDKKDNQEATAEGESKDIGDMVAAIAEGESETPDANIEDTNIIKQRRPRIPKELYVNGKTLLAEVTMDSMRLFCDQKFLIGNTVIVEFLVPNKFSVSANVIHCREYSMKSRVISKVKLPYRVIFQFAFLKKGEKTLLRQFLNSVEPERAVVHKKAAKKVEDDDDDDEGFDELDDLDL